MHYLIINPYQNANHGIANYINNLQSFTDKLESVSVLENKKNLSPIKFREYVKHFVMNNFGINEVIIEAPEAKAATLLLPKDYKVHIRLHCPLAIAQTYDGYDINQVEYSHELRVINKAAIVSSPSYGLLKELSDEVCRNDIFVYKNPIVERNTCVTEKIYDVVFMGRYQPLKGSEELNQVLQEFPSNYRVLVFGNNCRAHRLSPNVKCSVDFKNEVIGEEKFNLISNAKCLMQLSRFENCSMVILEALACHVPVVCWDVGGNAEIATKDILHPVKYLDFESFAKSVHYFVSHKVNTIDFEKALENINKDFTDGFNCLIGALKNNNASHINKYQGIDCSSSKYPVLLDRHTGSDHRFRLKIQPSKARILGIGYSNEHIEELWAPIISFLNFDSRYICRRPKGFHTVFNHDPYPITKGHYTQFDWVNDLQRLEKIILGYKPNLILFHNGLHPSYQNTLKFIKSFKVPILYSELGWFPQKNHVYFDKVGVNAKSFIAQQDFQSFTGKVSEENIQVSLSGKYALLALQLENDTNLIVSSQDFKKNINIIKYVEDQLKDKTVLAIKAHPLDKNFEVYKEYCDAKDLIFITSDIHQALSEAHSVISVNSTVLLEALEYPCNIYYLGDSILENKGVAINCKGRLLGDLWKNNLIYNANNRESLIQAFKDRQINLLSIREGKAPKDIAIQEFYNLLKIDVSYLIHRQKKDVTEVTEEKPPNVSKPRSERRWVRKFNKLRRTPILFFKDMLK